MHNPIVSKSYNIRSSYENLVGLAKLRMNPFLICINYVSKRVTKYFKLTSVWFMFLSSFLVLRIIIDHFVQLCGLRIVISKSRSKTSEHTQVKSNGSQFSVSVWVKWLTENIGLLLSSLHLVFVYYFLLEFFEVLFISIFVYVYNEYKWHYYCGFSENLFFKKS